MWSIHTLLFTQERCSDPCYSIDLENIMLSEISQIQKDKHYIFQLYEISRIGKFTERESELEIARGRGQMGRK